MKVTELQAPDFSVLSTFSNNSLILGQLSELAAKVHTTLGSGLAAAIYKRALDIELRYAGIDVDCEVDEPIYYDNYWIGKRKIDLLVNNTVLVSIKSEYSVDYSAVLELHNNLQAMDLSYGVLLNFGKEKAEIALVQPD